MLNKEVKHIDISNTPELIRLAEEVQKSNQVTVLTKDGEEMLEVRPPKPAKKKRAKAGPITMDDPLTKLIGIAHSGMSDISANKHKYLAEDYLKHHNNP